MEKHIAHFDLDSFFVSVERLRQPSLIGKPVIVGGSSDRGVVSSCSYEARSFGVKSAMSMKQARQLCPEAVIVRGDMDEYAKRSKEVTDIINDSAPLVEKASIDEHYLDLTGMDQFFGCYDWTLKLKAKITKETGLPISFGLSSSKTVAKIATGQAKSQGGALYIEHGKEKAFLAPLSVRKIPMVGEKTFQTLKKMGLEKIQSIQEIPVDILRNALGDHGVVIWNKANGIDDSPVEPLHERKSMSTETTFHQDVDDKSILRATLIKMVEELAYKMRKEQRLTCSIAVKIRYADFDTHVKQTYISATATDVDLIQAILQLWEKIQTRNAKVRLIGIRFSHLVSGSYQIDLFNDTITQVNLCQAMDRIRNRFGKDAVKRLSGITENKLKRKLKESNMIHESVRQNLTF